MKQRTALIVAAGATILITLAAGGVIRVMSQSSSATAQNIRAVSSSASGATITAPASDATVQQYRQLIDEANARIQTLKDENATLRQQLEAAKGTATDAASASAPEEGAISADAAAQAALNLAPGAQLLSTPELVNFRGVTAYEVVLDAGTVYVDAASGQPIYAISARQRNRQRFDQTQPAQPDQQDEQPQEQPQRQDEGGASS